MSFVVNQFDLQKSLTKSSYKIDAIRESLLNWFDLNGRHDIPWKLKQDGSIPKSKDHLPVYPILVAEIMLQQTQLKVVFPYWKKWMSFLPTLYDLANSNQQEILNLWQGLGYYSRALRLHDTSKLLIDLQAKNKRLNFEYWPTDLKTWTSFPGIGRSTAGSILSSAFNLPTPILDGNVKRILSRLIRSSKPPEKDLINLWKMCEFLFDVTFPRNFNQALMDLGSKICTKSNPKCLECPLQKYCSSYIYDDPTNYPVRLLKKTLSHFTIGIGVILNPLGKVLIDQRLETGNMAGMWEFPGGKQEKGESIQETIKRELYEELGVKVEVLEKLISLDHSYSHKKLHFEVYVCKLVSGKPQALSSQKIKWVDMFEIDEYPFPKANVKMIDALKKLLNKNNEN